MFRKFKPTRTLFFLTASKPRPERAPLSNQALVPGVWRLIYVSDWLGSKVPTHLVKHDFCEGVSGVTFETIDWVQQLALLTVGGPYSVNGRPELKKKDELEGTPAWLFKLGHWSPDLNWNFHNQLYWFSGLQTQTGIRSPAFLGPQLATADHGTSQPPRLSEPINSLFTHSLSLSLSSFSLRPSTDG